MNAREFRQRVAEFVRARGTGRPGEYRMWAGGETTLYASCFAAMTLHSLGALEEVEPGERCAWADSIRSWQDEKSGWFAGPELREGGRTSPLHDDLHLRMHSTAHALPALQLLGARPRFPLAEARRFLDCGELLRWLEARDFRRAWLEGNNLLFAAQFLLHLWEVEERDEAAAALELSFDWLDAAQDPATGLWGTDGACDAWTALYGGYHPLLAYHYARRRVRHAARILDTVLRLQHPDGGFAPLAGGGACEDVDAVDVLVNLHRRTGYRARAVRRALEAALAAVLRRQQPDGGFVYRRGEPFVHMGMTRTAVPRDTSQLFATWFAVHTIALAGELLGDHALSAPGWRFNGSCSMGWHDPSVRVAAQPDPWRDRLPGAGGTAARWLRHGLLRLPLRRARRLAGRVRRRLAPAARGPRPTSPAG